MPDLGGDLWLMGPMGQQAFWVWLTLGILLLGVETLIGTVWLMWMAGAAGLVAVACLTALPLGLPLQVVVFAGLTLVPGIFSKRIMKLPGNTGDVDDPSARMIGRYAVVLSGFGPVAGGERTGRVMFDGVEWPAAIDEVSDTQMPLNSDDAVEIAVVQDGRLFVKTMDKAEDDEQAAI
jgi:membrane protein implicated in regulation of membrane protease activity